MEEIAGLIIMSLFLQNVSGSGKELGQAYVNFTRNCMDQIRGKVVDELWILNFFEVFKKDSYFTSLFESNMCSHKLPVSFYQISNGTRRRCRCYVRGYRKGWIMHCTRISAPVWHTLSRYSISRDKHVVIRTPLTFTCMKLHFRNFTRILSCKA